jgi:glycosyltransferase involved in cell wall biosynthesis
VTPKISACLIVNNEERNIGRCIDSLNRIVDEVIVVDTGSTDDTIRIVTEKGAQVYFYKWHDDFSAARNYSFTKAKGNWIFIVDADEYIEESFTRDHIMEVLDNSKKFDAVRTRTININEDTSEVQMVLPHIRFIKNHCGIHFVNPIHEELKKGNTTSIKTYEWLDFYVVHTGYSSETVLRKNKLERNSRILKNAIQKQPDNGHLLFYLADTYISHRQWEEGFKFLEAAMDKKIDSKPIRTRLLYRYIECVRHFNPLGGEAIKLTDKAIEEFPDYSEFYYLKGTLLEEKQRYYDALGSFKQSLYLYTVFTDYPVTLQREQISVRIAYCYENLRMFHEAVEEYVILLKSVKWNKEIFVQLVSLLKVESSHDDIFLFLKRNFVIFQNKFMPEVIECMIYLGMFDLAKDCFNELPEVMESHPNLAIELDFYRNQEINKDNAKHLYEQKKHNKLGIQLLIVAILTEDQEIFTFLQDTQLNQDIVDLIDLLFGVEGEQSLDLKKNYLLFLEQLLMLERYDLFEHFTDENNALSISISEELGDLLDKFRLTSLAVYQYKLKLMNDPMNVIVQLKLAEGLIKIEEWAEAEKILLQLLIHHPYKFPIYPNIVQVKRKLNKIEDLFPLMKKAKSEFSDSNWVLKTITEINRPEYDKDKIRVLYLLSEKGLGTDYDVFKSRLLRVASIKQKKVIVKCMVLEKGRKNDIDQYDAIVLGSGPLLVDSKYANYLQEVQIQGTPVFILGASITGLSFQTSMDLQMKKVEEVIFNQQLDLGLIVKIINGAQMVSTGGLLSTRVLQLLNCNMNDAKVIGHLGALYEADCKVNPEEKSRPKRVIGIELGNINNALLKKRLEKTLLDFIFKIKSDEYEILLFSSESSDAESIVKFEKSLANFKGTIKHTSSEYNPEDLYRKVSNCDVVLSYNIETCVHTAAAGIPFIHIAIDSFGFEVANMLLPQTVLHVEDDELSRKLFEVFIEIFLNYQDNKDTLATSKENMSEDVDIYITLFLGILASSKYQRNLL